MRSRPLLIFNSLNKLIQYQGYKKYLTCLGDQLNTTDFDSTRSSCAILNVKLYMTQFTFVKVGTGTAGSIHDFKLSPPLKALTNFTSLPVLPFNACQISLIYYDLLQHSQGFWPTAESVRGVRQGFVNSQCPRTSLTPPTTKRFLK